MSLRRQYGLDRPMHMQYFIWIKNIVTKGDWGRSFSWNRPVADVLADRVPLTLAVSIAATIFVFVVAVPIGIFSATNQYSFFDFFFHFRRLHRHIHSWFPAGSHTDVGRLRPF